MENKVFVREPGCTCNPDLIGSYARCPVHQLRPLYEEEQSITLEVLSFEMIKHPRSIAGFSSMKYLAEKVGDLHYEALMDFLRELNIKLAEDSRADKERGRQKLSTELFIASMHLEHARERIKAALKICEPFMRK